MKKTIFLLGLELLGERREKGTIPPSRFQSPGLFHLLLFSSLGYLNQPVAKTQAIALSARSCHLTSCTAFLSRYGKKRCIFIKTKVLLCPSIEARLENSAGFISIIVRSFLVFSPSPSAELFQRRLL